jgi:predicted nucleic-acid-binding Zn-ribbon protein
MSDIKKRYVTDSCRQCGKVVSQTIPVEITTTVPPHARIRCSECRTTNFCKPEPDKQV